MPSTFDTWIGYILASEGPELNLGSGEPGGGSRYGVSVTALSDYKKSLGLPVATVADITAMTEDYAKQFYTWFFAPLRLDQMSAGVAYRLADVATNRGIAGGINDIQSAIGFYPRVPSITDQLLTAVNAADPREVIYGLSGVWLGRKDSASNWTVDGHGFTNRRNAATQQALEMVS